MNASKTGKLTYSPEEKIQSATITPDLSLHSHGRYEPSGLDGSSFRDPNMKCGPPSGGVAVGVLSSEVTLDVGELTAQYFGSEGTGCCALTIATFASNVLALCEGERHRSESRWWVVWSDTVTEAGVTDGGVSGERLFCMMGFVKEAAERTGLGSEINVGGFSTAANLFDEGLEVWSKEERLLLFEGGMVTCGGRGLFWCVVCEVREVGGTRCLLGCVDRIWVPGLAGID